MISDTHLERLLTYVIEEICAFEFQNHVNNMYISRFRCGVGLVYFVLTCKKSNLGEALLFKVNLPLLEHFVDKNR